MQLTPQLAGITTLLGVFKKTVRLFVIYYRFVNSLMLTEFRTEVLYNKLQSTVEFCENGCSNTYGLLTKVN
jgi:hypothetical protein